MGLTVPAIVPNINISNTGCTPQDFCDVLNNAESLGLVNLNNGQGITQADLVRASNTDHARNNPNLRRTLLAMANNYRRFDQNNDGFINHQDLEGIFNDNIGRFNPLRTFRGEAVAEGERVMELYLGIKR